MANIKNVKIKPVPIDFLDKPRSLVFDMNAFSEIEEHYGDIDVALEQMGKGSIKAIRLLLWAGLLHELDDGEELTIKQVGKMVLLSDIEQISIALMAAIEQAMPDIKEKTEGKLQMPVPQE